MYPRDGYAHDAEESLISRHPGLRPGPGPGPATYVDLDSTLKEKTRPTTQNAKAHTA